MKTFYITFGQIHTHRINGVTVDCDCWVEIHSTFEKDARQKADELFGQKWSMIYKKYNFDSSHFPRGCILEFSV